MESFSDLQARWKVLEMTGRNAAPNVCTPSNKFSYSSRISVQGTPRCCLATARCSGGVLNASQIQLGAKQKVHSQRVFFFSSRKCLLDSDKRFFHGHTWIWIPASSPGPFNNSCRRDQKKKQNRTDKSLNCSVPRSRENVSVWPNGCVRSQVSKSAALRR